MLKILEQKNNTSAFVLILITAVVYSTLGVVSAYAQNLQTSFLSLITYASLFAISANYILLLKKGISVKKAATHIFQNQKIRRLFYFRLLLSTHTFFTIAGFYLLLSKNLGVLVYEIHPMISIVFSYFILKDDYNKKENLFYSWILIAVATTGILLVLYQEIYITQQYLFGQGLGILLVLVATLFRGLIAPIAPKMSLLLESNSEDFNKFDNALIIQFLSLACVLPLFIIANTYFYETNIAALLLPENILIAGYLGVFIIFGSAVTHNIAGSIANTHNIYLGYFIAPATGVLLLWFFGYAEITPPIILAFILILTPNILLNLDIEYTLPLKTAFIWALLSAIFLFNVQGNPINIPTYFSSSIALLVIFALTARRLIPTPSNFTRQLFISFSHKVPPPNKAKGKPKKSTQSPLSNSTQKTLLRNFTKLLALLLISIPLITLIILYRDNTFLYDAFALLTTTVVVFTLALAIEKMFYTAPNPKFNKTDTANHNHAAGITLLMLLITALFFANHNFA